MPAPTVRSSTLHSRSPSLTATLPLLLLVLLLVGPHTPTSHAVPHPIGTPDAVGSFDTIFDTLDVTCFTAFGSWGTGSFVQRTLAESLAQYHTACGYTIWQLMAGDHVLPTAPTTLSEAVTAWENVWLYHHFGSTVASSDLQTFLRGKAVGGARYVLAPGDREYLQGKDAIDTLRLLPRRLLGPIFHNNYVSL